MRLLIIMLLLLMAGVLRPVAAQDDVAFVTEFRSEHRGDDGLPASRYLTSIHFRVLFGGIIIGKARIDGFPDSLNFIFDTGCGSVSLDSVTAVHYGLSVRRGSAFIHGVAGICPQRLVDSQSLHLGDITIDSLSMQVCDYDILSSIYGEKIDGIIGYTLFSRYLVKVDYDKQRMDLYTKGPITYPKGGYLLKPRVFGLPMLEGQVADARDVRSRFYFDTGAGLCLLFSSNFATDSAVFSPKRKKPVRIEGAGLGGKTEMQLTTLRNFSLGPFRFRQIPTYIFEDAYDVTSYPQLAGLIGNDLLRRFNLIVNYDRSEIYILPNEAFSQPFDYSYSGISIARIGGKIIVTDVMTESPGEKAGFKEGDVVLAINKDTGQDLQTYQALLRTIGPKVKVLVQRESGDLVILSLKVTSIL